MSVGNDGGGGVTAAARDILFGGALEILGLLHAAGGVAIWIACLGLRPVRVRFDRWVEERPEIKARYEFRIPSAQEMFGRGDGGA